MRRALFLPFILCAALGAAQTVMVLRDGSRLKVESFEIRDALVVITALDGKLQSLPLSLVDLEATQALGTVEIVPLRFGWRPGMAARVDVTTSQGTRTHQLLVREHEDGLLVESSDAATSFVVTLNGAFLRALEPADDPGLAEQWNRLAGFWRGAELELGAVYQLETELPFSRVDGRLLPMLLEFGASAWVPCTPELTTAECVELVLHAYPDPARVNFSEQAGQAIYEGLHLEKTITLIARAEGLIPYSLTTLETAKSSEAPSETREQTTRFFWAQ